ncbi:hypothetical protein, partial [Pseudomonas aeruginosa]
LEQSADRIRVKLKPKVRAYYAGEEFQLTAEQSERPAAS